MSVRRAPRIGFSFEYIMWVFTRLSGLTLILLAISGITGALIMGARTQMGVGDLFRWMFFPNTYHVVNTEIPDVTLGWANAFWMIMQILIVFFGVSHGVNGLRVVIEDYIEVSWLRILLRGLIFLFWLFMLLVGIFVIITV